MKAFLKHPKENDMTYLQHFRSANGIGLLMFGCFLCLFLHSIFPFMFKTVGTTLIKKLSKKLDK